MSDHRRRIDTINVLITSSVISNNSSLLDTVKEEFCEVYRLREVKCRHRRRLLQVLHSTRGLDSALAGFLAHYGYSSSHPSLGNYLQALMSPPSGCPTRISDRERRRYQRTIVRVRNRYMHEAGTFPVNDPEVITLLAEMQNCLARVLDSAI